MLLRCSYCSDTRNLLHSTLADGTDYIDHQNRLSIEEVHIAITIKGESTEPPFGHLIWRSQV